jgi:hypothetical protein
MSFPNKIDNPVTSDIDLTSESTTYEKHLQEFNELLYEPKVKKFNWISLTPKNLSIIFAIFYLQGIFIVYYLFDKDYSHSDNGKFLYIKFFMSTLYVTISMIVYLLLFFLLIKKYIFLI